MSEQLFIILITTAGIIILMLLFCLYLYSRERKEKLKVIKDLRQEKERNKKHIDDLDSLFSMLNRFQEVGLMYSSKKDIKVLCDLIVDYTTELLDTDMGSIMLLNKATNMLEIISAKGLPKDIVKNTKMSISEGIAGKVARNGSAIYCEDIEKDVRFMRSSRLKYPTKAFVSVPLKVKEKVIGVINVNCRNECRKFNSRDIKIISIIADQAAVAIGNIQLYSDIKEMYLGTIQTLAEAIDAKDSYTRGHAERVTMYAVEIAREMQLSRQLIKNIEFASLIHDIGKIGVKDCVLTKPGKLSESEYEEIKQHPQTGEQILAPIEFLTNIAPLILYHHEQYNGAGYPEGIRGEEIPVGARIINVADAFEAMISERPYSKGMTVEEAIEELKDGAGTQFDPDVVDAFIRVLKRKENKEIYGYYKDKEESKQKSKENSR